jgi:hypothetical protein
MRRIRNTMGHAGRRAAAGELDRTAADRTGAILAVVDVEAIGIGWRGAREGKELAR